MAAFEVLIKGGDEPVVGDFASPVIRSFHHDHEVVDFIVAKTEV